MSGTMQLLDRIELRRFVGREFLLWIWLESELFEATLETKAHGSFGLWLEGRLVLSAGQESTVIKGSAPGNHREAKESLLRGKLPDRVGLHISWGDNESTLTLRGEQMAFAGLTLPTKLGKAEDEAPAIAPPPPPRKKKKGGGRGDAPSDEAHEAFYERMHLTREVENIFEALYTDFLTLRLGPAWSETVFPALEAWVAGKDVDADRYRRARNKHVPTGRAR